jgi:osmotically-inducible protein OsmY
MDKLILRAIPVAISLAFSAGAIAQSMSKTEYKSTRDAIAAEYKSAIAACTSMSGNAKDVCKADATGKDKVAKAQLEERRAPSNKNRYAVSAAKARADYSVAKERCDDKSANDRKACVSEAKAAEDRAIADAKAEMKSADAGKPAKAAAAAAPSKKETTQEYVDDSVITAKVKTAVFENPSLKSAEINVETHKGIVQLSGFVRSRADINRAVEVARGVKGVASVKNDMIVKGQQ